MSVRFASRIKTFQFVFVRLAALNSLSSRGYGVIKFSNSSACCSHQSHFHTDFRGAQSFLVYVVIKNNSSTKRLGACVVLKQSFNCLQTFKFVCNHIK